MTAPTNTKFYRLKDESNCKFWVSEPKNVVASRVLVLVHGISRNAEHMLRSFSNLARRNNYTLIVPYFDRVNYPDYQRLGRHGRGHRADRTLNKILDTFFACDSEKAHIFGFSGGRAICPPLCTCSLRSRAFNFRCCRRLVYQHRE